MEVVGSRRRRSCKYKRLPDVLATQKSSSVPVWISAERDDDITRPNQRESGMEINDHKVGTSQNRSGINFSGLVRRLN